MTASYPRPELRPLDAVGAIRAAVADPSGESLEALVEVSAAGASLPREGTAEPLEWLDEVVAASESGLTRLDGTSQGLRVLVGPRLRRQLWLFWNDSDALLISVSRTGWRATPIRSSSADVADAALAMATGAWVAAAAPGAT